MLDCGAFCGGVRLGKHALSLLTKSHLYDVFKAEKQEQNQERVKVEQAPFAAACLFFAALQNRQALLAKLLRFFALLVTIGRFCTLPPLHAH